MPRKLLTSTHGADVVPDVPNFSWVEYGLRVGMPRLFALFGERKLPVSAFINAAVCDDYSRLAERVGDAKWEIVGHGYWQRSLQSEGAEERQVIDKSLERLARFYGVRPRGWLGPGLKESFDTPDHLKAAGIDYVCDWVIDDLPNWMETRHGPLICMPYTLELNDSTLYAVQQHPSDAMYQRMQDSIACFGRELDRYPRILTLALHPHLIAVPHRMVYLERMVDELMRRADTIFMTGSDIADWYSEADAITKEN
jgi:peptidoglycan/xylan/chitin deacetylase (PgdA/CDA1 family)